MRLVEALRLVLLLALTSAAAGLDIPLEGMSSMMQLKITPNDCAFKGPVFKN